VALQSVASLIEDARVIIFNMFIIQGTDEEFSCTELAINLVREAILKGNMFIIQGTGEEFSCTELAINLVREAILKGKAQYS
jgi:hypothetical protein